MGGVHITIWVCRAVNTMTSWFFMTILKNKQLRDGGVTVNNEGKNIISIQKKEQMFVTNLTDLVAVDTTKG